MDSIGLEKFRAAMISSLRDISQLTERIYLKMGDAYPALIGELESGLGLTGGVGAARQNLVRSTAQTLRTIQDRKARTDSSLQAGQILLAELDLQMDQLQALESGIALIREDSSLMELLSLNAMVIAVRAGTAGRAFSSISDELQKNSLQTLKLTDQVELGEKSLFRSFAAFKSSLQELNQDAAAGISSFLVQIQEVFEALSRGSQDLVERLDSLRSQTAEVKAPLVAIMVEIQNQDRIRQSLDHVVLVLEELTWDSGTESTDAGLNNVGYLEALLKLCTLVLEEVRGLIGQNRLTFSASLEQAGKVIRDLQTRRERLAGAESSFGFENWLEKGETGFRIFDEHSKLLGRQQELTLNRSEILRRSSKSLVESLQAFDGILSRFRNIDLAARIQIARHVELSSMKGNASEMSSLTQRMDQHMSHCIGVTGVFFDAVGGIFESFQTESGSRLQQEQSFRQDISKDLEGLRDATAALNKSLRESEVFSGMFLRQFSQTAADLETLHGLDAEIGEKLAVLADLGREVSIEKQGLLRKADLKQWKLSETRFQELIRRFTIYSHKNYAAQLADFQIDSSAESGEVTLF